MKTRYPITMLDPLDEHNRPFLRNLEKKRSKIFWITALKTLSLHTWRPVFWILLFCGLWMLDIPEFLGITGKIAAPVIFLIGLFYLIRTDLGKFGLPRGKNLDHVLEESSHLPRGQIQIIEDTLANPKKHETRALWNNAQKQALHGLKALKAPKLNLSLARHDPGAIRFIAVLLFISGLIISGHTWQEKIVSGLFPVAPSYVLAQGKTTNLWIKPPPYTQIPQTHVIGTTVDEPLQIPEGSTIKIRLHSIFGQNFSPVFQGKNMDYLGEGLYGAQTVIEPGTALNVTQMFIPRARWSYNYITDTPPEIALDLPATKEGELTPAPYEEIEHAQIKIPLKVKDDYGVKDLKMTLTLDPMIEDKPLGHAASETRLIMSQPDTEFKIAPVYDMSWHTWAGLPVDITFEAIDQKGQSVELSPIKLTLPERMFEHPMAKSLIKMRKKLAWEYNDDFNEIAFNLETLLGAPDYFQNNPVIYLAIKTASARLHYNNNARPDIRLQAAKDVIALLWATALAIEEGNLSLAMRELRDAQRALENTLRDPNATDEDIAAAMEELREKMENYFTEMARDIQKRMENGENFSQFSDQDFGQMLTPDTLSQMMAQIEQALREGNQEKAEELMSQMQRLLEMLDPNMRSAMPQDMQMMQEGINELQELIEKQEALLEQTQDIAKDLGNLRRKEQYKPAPRELQSLEEMLKDFGFDNLPPPPAPQQQSSQQPADDLQKEETLKKCENSAIEQKALRYILGQLMLDAAEKLDDVPESMGKAEQEMRGSEENLAATHPSGAIPHQEKAIEYLKEAQENLSQQFRQRMQQMIGIGLSGGAQNYDPLGRPLRDGLDGSNHGSRVEIPDEARKKQVDEILRELRDRLGDRSRPREEHDYYRRLLRQF